KIPAPTIDSTTIAVRANNESFCVDDVAIALPSATNQAIESRLPRTVPSCDPGPADDSRGMLVQHHRQCMDSFCKEASANTNAAAKPTKNSQQDDIEPFRENPHLVSGYSLMACHCRTV